MLTARLRLTFCLPNRSGDSKQGMKLTPKDIELVDPCDLVHCLRAARGGAQPAFERLYRRFAPMVHGILLGRFRPALADELTQECFTTAFARLDQLREDHKFGGWIAAMARRMQTSEGVQAEAIELPIDLASSATTPDDNAEATRMLRTIAALPEAYRETLMMRLVEGLSGAEIATLSGLTPESVRVNLHRGMEKLRAALDLQSPQPGNGARP